MNADAPTTRQRVRRRNTTRWIDSPWRVITRAIGAALVITLMVGTLVIALLPRALGGDTLTVLSGSMEPTFAAGDAIAVRGVDTADVCTDVSVGDIITFFPEANDPTLITHRVIGKTIGTFDDGTSCRLVTQGDANSAVDAPVSPEQVRGVVMFSVPKLGTAREWVTQNPVSVVVGIGVALLIWAAVGTLRRPRTRVISSPAPAGVRSAATLAPAQPAPAAHTTPTAQPLHPHEHTLLLRELKLREREVALLERELALSHADSAPHAPHLPKPEGGTTA